MARQEGLCKLTGKYGRYAKSHIIPKSLTQPAYEGGMLFQHAPGLRPQKRRTSWYDYRIVIDEGEAILSQIDDWGVKFLRTNRLVWSGFGPVTNISPDLSIDGVGNLSGGYGFRRIKVPEPEKLRRFALSILWRAATSTLPEMSEIALDKIQQERLANYIVGNDILPIDWFSCGLTQHNQVGFIHNHAPMRDTMIVPNVGKPPKEVDIFRFYFDGLVLHFHIPDSTGVSAMSDSDLAVGFSNELIVSCVPWLKSWQLENILTIGRESLW